MSKTYWKISSYIWGFCTAGWAWIAVEINYGPALAVATGCALLTVISVYNAET